MSYLWKKVAALGFLVFLILWAVGILRSYALPYPQPAWPIPVIEELSARNASANNLKQIGLAQTPLPAVLDQAEVERIQVHEKHAQLATGTTTFDDDAAEVRKSLAEHQATVFNEKNGGLAPERRLTLEIGVHPDRFDALVEQLRHIAHLDTVNVQQRDRTGEFRRLHAQRQSLKKYQESILKLRAGKNPTIDESLKLEQRAQEIEKELQALGVQLGDLLGKESFYLVSLTLFEYQPGSKLDRTYTLPRRLLNAFLWALAWWFGGVVAVGVLVGTWVSVQTLWAKPALATPHPQGTPAT
jgi:hypothetical protein